MIENCDIETTPAGGWHCRTCGALWTGRPEPATCAGEPGRADRRRWRLIRTAAFAASATVTGLTLLALGSAFGGPAMRAIGGAALGLLATIGGAP